MIRSGLILQISQIRTNQGKKYQKLTARHVIMIVLMMIDLKTEDLSDVIE
ncbi:MAG: hypothetical protein M3299_02950 [Thermoproteota archaeon]|nr:hypothetical protein [Thermoproteota archaeon]